MFLHHPCFAFLVQPYSTSVFSTSRTMWRPTSLFGSDRKSRSGPSFPRFWFLDQKWFLFYSLFFVNSPVAIGGWRQSLASPGRDPWKPLLCRHPPLCSCSYPPSIRAPFGEDKFMMGLTLVLCAAAMSGFTLNFFSDGSAKKDQLQTLSWSNLQSDPSRTCHLLSLKEHSVQIFTKAIGNFSF